MANKLSFKKAKVGLLALITTGIGLGTYGTSRLVQSHAKEQMVETLTTLADEWQNASRANGKLDYFSLNDKEYKSDAKARGADVYQYYGPYSLGLKQLEMAGFVEKNAETKQYKFTGKEVGGVAVDSRSKFLALDSIAHEEVFMEMLLGASKKFEDIDPDLKTENGLLPYILAAGDIEQYQQMVNSKDSDDKVVVDNLLVDGEVAKLSDLQAKFGNEDLLEMISRYEVNKAAIFTHYAVSAVTGATDIQVEADDEPIVTPTIDAAGNPDNVNLEEPSRGFVNRLFGNKLHEEVVEHLWKDVSTAEHGVYKDSKGTRRYTALSLSMADLKIADMLVVDKSSGAYIWSEQSKVHESLGVSYDEYKANYTKYADDARTAFTDWAKDNYESLNNKYLQNIWDKVVQPGGLDQYIGAQDYKVDGKKYTMDGISIAAMCRFHGVNKTKKFLQSIDRENPEITKGMERTIQRFNDIENDLDLNIASWREFEGEDGKTFRHIDFRKQYEVQDMDYDDYIIALEKLSLRESGFNKKAGSYYKGLFQLSKKYLKENYLPDYNKENGTNYTVEDFDNSAKLQTEIIRDYHEESAKYVAGKGLIKYTPYVMNENMVELEYIQHINAKGHNFLLSPETMNKAKFVSAGDGKSEFGFQVGAVYDLGGDRLVKVKSVGTRSFQIDPLNLTIMSHLGGAGNLSRSLNPQYKKGQQFFHDGNKITINKYGAMIDHALNDRTRSEVSTNKHLHMPNDKNGDLKDKFHTDEVLKATERAVEKEQNVEGRDEFNVKKYKRQQKVSKENELSSIDNQTAKWADYVASTKQNISKELSV